MNSYQNNLQAFDSYGDTSFASFMEAIDFGREIEFNLKGHKFFHQPFYEDPEHVNPEKVCKYILYDCNDESQMPTRIFYGTKEELLNYPFFNRMTLNEHFCEFSIDYIL